MYAWVTYRGLAKKGQYFLVDTGAMISILPLTEYEEMSSSFKTPISATDQKIKTGNNSQCDVRGTAIIEFVAGNTFFKHKFYICADASCPILGLDYLRKNKIQIDPCSNMLRGNTGKKDMFIIPCKSSEGFMAKSKVALVRNYTIAPGAEAVIPAQIQGSTDQNGKVCVVERVNTCLDKTGALICRTTVIPEQGIVPVRFMNATTEPIRLWKGSVVGLVEPVISCSEMTSDPVSDTLCECKCDCLNKSGKPDPTVKCCHGLEQNSSTDSRYDYLTINQLVAHDLHNQTRDPDSAIPEHVKELYFASLPALQSYEQRVRLSEILVEYQDVFARHADDIGRTGLVKHHIDTGDAKPVHQRCRRLARAHVQVLKDQVKKLAAAGIIRPSDSNWAANPVVVDKKTLDAKRQREKRVCIDYRGLNAVTVNPDSYMLPRIDDTLDALSGAKYFCTLDLTQGYHQVELTEESKKKTAFHAPYCNPSQWEYNYMPFGLVKAPRTFQRLMDRVIRNLEYEMALAYLDDVIVFGPNLDLTMDRMVIILERLRSANLKLKAKKCELFKQEVNYLGHVITANGVKTDPKKVEDVVNWHPPRTVRQVRAFLGIINYYSRFIRDLAQIAHPLHELTKKFAKFVWTDKHQKAFEMLKQRLVSAPIMAYPNQEGKFILDTDASDYGYGAVLSQVQKDERGVNQERVIAYASKKFNERQQNYCARKRELLAILEFVEHFDVYLRGVSFLIRTDHASLRYIRTTKDLPKQFFRWIMRLEEYSYKIEIRKGVLHGNADGMSRGCHGVKNCIYARITEFERRLNVKPGYVFEEEDPEEVFAFFCNTYHLCEDEDEQLDCMVYAMQLNPAYSAAELAEMQKKDGDIAPVLEALTKDPDNPPDWEQISGLSAANKYYFREWQRLPIHGGLLYRRWESDDGTQISSQLIVPLELQMEFCEKVHDTTRACHMGKRKTLSALTHFCFWWRMAADVTFWCKTCVNCQRRQTRTRKNKAPIQIFITGEPNERLQMDICGPLIKTAKGNIYILVITDMFTKYTEAYAMPNQTAETVADNLVNGWIKKKGPPLELHTDQGANFQSKLISQVCDLLKIKKTRTSAYHPQGDGQVERFNRTMIDMIRKMVEDNSKDTWDEYLDDVVAAYNGMKHASTGYSPNYLWFGRELRFALGSVVEQPTDKENLCDYVVKLKQNLHKAYQIARVRLKMRALQNKAYVDRSTNLKKYYPGDKVQLEDHTIHEAGTKKLQPFYTEPWFVIDKLSEVTYRLQQADDQPPKITHHDRMKELASRESYQVPDWVVRRSKELRKTITDPDNHEPLIIKPKGRIPPALLAKDKLAMVKLKTSYPTKRKKIINLQDKPRRDRKIKCEINREINREITVV